MAEENGTADVQEPAADDFSRTLGGTPGEENGATDTPAPDDTPAFDASKWNAETGSLEEVPENARPFAEAFQRRVREMRAGVSDKVGEVNKYEEELKALRDEMAAMKSSQPESQPEAQPPGQTYSEVAQALGVNETNSTPEALRSLSSVCDIIDNHPAIRKLAAVESELSALKESSGEITSFVDQQKDTAYTTEYEAAVEAHGKDLTDKIMSDFGDWRGRPSPIDGKPFTVASLVATASGKLGAEASQVDAKAQAAQAAVRSAAGGIAVTSGLSDDGTGTPTEAEVDGFFKKNF